VPFNAIPAENFLNRGYELDYLRGLFELKRNALGGNVFLEGSRGIGKTELLKQLYRVLFWEEKAVPFYYSFRTANLRGSYFARDYFTRFVRQYLAFLKKEPAITDQPSEPLLRLLPALSSLGLTWLIDCVENFQDHVRNNDLYWQMVAAISAPVLAAQRGALPVIVMLDDFDAAANLFESSLGDGHGLVTLFAESMRSRLCPHAITGAAGALEAILADPSLAGLTERLPLGPLPKDLAGKLFKTHLARLKIKGAADCDFEFLDTLKGNPLYLRNLAKAAWKMQKNSLTEEDLVECYSLDVTEGETAFYWSSLLKGITANPAARKQALALLAEQDRGSGGGQRLLTAAGWSRAEADALLASLLASGLAQKEDAVLGDFIYGRVLMEVEDQAAGAARGKIAAPYLDRAEGSCFELTIPMSENAELVVAKAVEQIGKNMNLDEDFLNRLQLALIEVCINAMEHSGSYDRKVFLKMVTRPEKLEIVVESSGRPFSVDSRTELPVEEKLQAGMRRGWGFKLVQGIMDSVKVERINDRTRVILTKNTGG
jgi:anti-sigma regulatory factor (Ser/Thr protein kinase)